MLFNEIYGIYFNVVAAILSEAVNGNLTGTAMNEIVREKAFAESVLTIPTSLLNETWPLLTSDLSVLKTPLLHKPTMPLTTLQKRWLKSLLQDPRIRLFSPSSDGLEEVQPLYPADVFVYFDRYSDGDPYEDSDYNQHFQRILTGLSERRKLCIRFSGHQGRNHCRTCIPVKLEYSSKDDKFRLLATSSGRAWIINLARIQSCELLEPYSQESFRPVSPPKKTLVMELTDERNALERVMLHFSHLEKETVRLDDILYRITLQYEKADENELLIRVLSFGPMLKVISPDSFIMKIKDRLNKQEKMRTQK